MALTATVPRLETCSSGGRFLEQRGQAAGWQQVGVPAVSGFLACLRNGRTVEHALGAPSSTQPSVSTLEARLAEVVSFYSWQAKVFDVPVAGRSLRGGARRDGLRRAVCGRPGAPATRRRRPRRCGHARRQPARPPLLAPADVQAILDGCAVCDPASGEWVVNLRDRLLFALLAETGCRRGEVLGLRIDDVVIGCGSTGYVEIVPREDNPNGARVGIRGRLSEVDRPRSPPGSTVGVRGMGRCRCDRHGRGAGAGLARAGGGRARPCRALATVARRSARRSHFALCGLAQSPEGHRGTGAEVPSGSPGWSPDTESRGVIVDRLSDGRAVGRRSSSAQQ